jgi:thiol:disulfide interchange protein
MKRNQIGALGAGALSALTVLCCLLGASPLSRAASSDVDALVSQSRAAKSGDDFLPPDQAFVFSASAQGPDRVRLDWIIAPGYYL